jgi:predicted metal-binding membrane protein
MSDYALTHIPAAAARLGALAARPRLVASACVLALTALGWSAFAAMTAEGHFWAICATSRGADLPLAAGLWLAMTLAMMLPSAAPMILTYAQIAETAARKGERIVSPLVIAAGYCAVWIGFAIFAVLVQLQLAAHAIPMNVARYLSSALFAGAGLYQFTALKHACLEKCRHPFQFFFTNWRTTKRGVFGLGLRQGMACLGCCWAMMALMLVTGAMNVVWMAALAIFMTIEKMATSRFISHAGGVALIAIGLTLAVTG